MHQSTLSNHAEKSAFESKWDYIHNICLRKAFRWVKSCPRCYEAQDLAMMAAEKVCCVFHKYDASKPLDKYVNSIAFSVFVDISRGRDPYCELSLDETRQESVLQEGVACSVIDRDDDTENRPAYSVESESSSIALALEPLLSCLPWRQRMVIEMSFGLGDCWWERTDESIAEELGVTRQTVISDRKKAIEEMQIRVGTRTTRVMAA